MAAPKRVLMLHGYTQNASILSKRLGAIRRQCGKDVEFVFLDGPHILEPADLDAQAVPTDAAPTPTTSPDISAPASNPETIQRGWWRRDKEKGSAFGIEETLLMLRDVLSRQRFDGVFGFSQGAALAVMLAILLERPQLHPPFMIDGQGPHPPLNFCIAVSGFKSKDPFSNLIYSSIPQTTPSPLAAYDTFDPSHPRTYTAPSPLATPILHVVGLTDAVIPPSTAGALIRAVGGRVEEHDGGHFIPSKAGWRRFLCAYLRAGGAGGVPPPDAGPVEAGAGAGSGALLGMKL